MIIRKCYCIPPLNIFSPRNTKLIIIPIAHPVVFHVFSPLSKLFSSSLHKFLLPSHPLFQHSQTHTLHSSMGKFIHYSRLCLNALFPRKPQNPSHCCGTLSKHSHSPLACSICTQCPHILKRSIHMPAPLLRKC